MARKTIPSRTRFEASLEKKSALRQAEAAGQVADSHEVRLVLMARVHRGELSLEAAQAELKRIQRDAKKSGKQTRAQVVAKS